MASSSEKRDEPPPSAGSRSGGALPRDALYEIMLRLPARDLCRLRAVCPSWRSLTSDPLFVEAHAARHTGPLLATTFVDGESCGVSIVDLPSGDVVKRIRTGDRDSRVQRAHLDLVCLVGRRHPLAVPVTVLNPATGAALSSSHIISDKYEYLLKKRDVSMDSCTFGKVPSTGEYKVLRFILVRPLISRQQLCEVMTLDGSGHARWRAKPGPPAPVLLSNMKSLVIDGVAYFLIDFAHPHWEYLETTIKPASIASFNFETEEWMATVNGPEPVSSFYEDDDFPTLPILDDPAVEFLSITNLNGFLVMVHAVHFRHYMDLWFLVDVEKGLWVKRYHICYSRTENLFSYPLLVLDDERVIFIMQAANLLQSYDPKTETYNDMLQLEDYKSVGIYTGSLLS